MTIHKDGVTIGTISGGIVNFGGAGFIAPISVTKTITGAGEANTGATITTRSGLSSANQQTISEILNAIRTML